ncbi:hypothetical protein ACWCYZ_46660, partial [Streptomyces virginiae]
MTKEANSLGLTIRFELTIACITSSGSFSCQSQWPWGKAPAGQTASVRAASGSPGSCICVVASASARYRESGDLGGGLGHGLGG